MASGLSKRSFSRLSSHLDWSFTQYDMNNPPSVVNHVSPLTLLEERELRKSSAVLILSTRKQLPIQLTEIFKSMVLMHRFYMVRPVQEYDMRKVVIACLIEACKENKRIQPDKITTVIDDQLSNSVYHKFLSKDRTNPNYESLLTETLGHGAMVNIPYESFFLKHNAIALFKSCLIMSIFCVVHTTWYLTMEHTCLFLIHVRFLKENGNWDLSKSFIDDEPWSDILNRSEYLATLDELYRELLEIYDMELPKLSFFLRNISKDADITQGLSEMSLE